MVPCGGGIELIRLSFLCQPGLSAEGLQDDEDEDGAAKPTTTQEIEQGPTGGGQGHGGSKYFNHDILPLARRNPRGPDETFNVKPNSLIRREVNANAVLRSGQTGKNARSDAQVQ